MLKQKVFVSGWVTAEFIEFVVGGYQTIVGQFIHNLVKSAQERDYVLLPGSRVHFEMPHLMDTPPCREMVKVSAVGWAVKVTKIPQQLFSQGDTYQC